MAAIDGLIAAGWVIFWLYWIISATRTKKNASSNSYVRRFIGVRIVILIFVIVALHLSAGARRSLGKIPLVQNNHALIVTGLVLFVSGLSLAIWARLYLGKNWGMPMSLKQDPELVTSGPYRLIRHPIYSGFLLALLGSALAISLYWLIILVFAGGYFIYSAFIEDRIMLHQFPKTYPSYKAKTRMLIPFVL